MQERNWKTGVKNRSKVETHTAERFRMFSLLVEDVVSRSRTWETANGRQEMGKLGSGKWERGGGEVEWEMGQMGNGKWEMGKRGKGHGNQGLEQGLVKIVIWNTRNKTNGFSKLEHKHF